MVHPIISFFLLPFSYNIYITEVIIDAGADALYDGRSLLVRSEIPHATGTRPVRADAIHVVMILHSKALNLFFAGQCNFSVTAFSLLLLPCHVTAGYSEPTIERLGA